MKKRGKKALPPRRNPILEPQRVQDVRLDRLESPMVHRRRVNAARRELRDLRNRAAAAEAIEGLDRETEIFGFTRGQFNLLDLFHACLDKTGPAAMTVSTWEQVAILPGRRLRSGGRRLRKGRTKSTPRETKMSRASRQGSCQVFSRP